MDGMPVTIDKRFSPDIGVEPTIKFRWALRFEPDAERARVARIMALHCKGR